MTRDDATTAITKALEPASSGAQLADNTAFAQRLAAALDALGILQHAGQMADNPPWRAQQQSQNEPQITHHRVDTAGQVSTPHPMTETRHGLTGDPQGQSWRRQPQPEPQDTTEQ